MPELQTLRRPAREGSAPERGASGPSRPAPSADVPVENLPPVYLRNRVPDRSPPEADIEPPDSRIAPEPGDEPPTPQETASGTGGESFDATAESTGETAPEAGEAEGEEGEAEDEQEAAGTEEDAAAESETAAEKGETEEGTEGGETQVLLSNAPRAGGRERGGKKMDLPDIPPLALPRLNNVKAPHIPSPPKPAVERSAEIVQKTGSPPSLHHAQVRDAVQRVAQTARNSQRQVVWRINLLAKDTKLSFFQIAAEISRHIRYAIGAINGAITRAKDEINDVVSGVEQHFDDHEALLGEELQTSMQDRSEEVRTQLLDGNTALQEAHTELQAEFGRYLEPAKTNMRKIGTDGEVAFVPAPPGAEATNNAPPTGDNMNKLQEAIDRKYGRLNNTDIGKYVAHRARPVVSRMYDGTQSRFETRYGEAADSMEDLRVGFTFNALQLVTPSVHSTDEDTPQREQESDDEHNEQIEEVREGKAYNLGQIHKKQRDATAFLDIELGPKLIEGLHKMEAKAVGTFRHQGRSTERLLQNAAAPMALAYPDIVRRLEEMLPKEKLLVKDKFLPSIQAAEKSAFELPDSQMQPLSERAAFALNQAQEGKKKQLEAIAKSVNQGSEAINDVAIKTSFDMDHFAFQSTGVMRDGGRENIRQAQGYALRIANDLLSTKEQANSQLNALLGNYVTSFNRNLKSAGEGYFDAVENFKDNLLETDSGVFDRIAAENRERLSDSASTINQNLTRPDPAVTTGLVVANVLSLGASTAATAGYLIYMDADEGDVFKAIGDLDWPGQAALEEYFNSTHYEGPLRRRIRDCLEEDDAQYALAMFSPNADERAQGRLNAAEASLSWTDFGIDDDAREALLAGMSAEERAAADDEQMARIGEEINSSWTMTDTEIRLQQGYLNGDISEVLAARMEDNVRRARQNGDATIQQSVEGIDQLARTELSRHQSMTFLQPQDVQGLIDEAMVDFARHRPGETREEIGLTEARQTFVDFATADRTYHHSGAYDHHGGGAPPPPPIPVDQFVKDYVEEVVTNGFYVEREDPRTGEMVWEQNQEAQAAAQAYQVHRAETGFGGPSEQNVTQFNAAFRNPTLQRLELRMQEAREESERTGEPIDPELVAQYNDAKGKHDQQMERVARRLGMTDEQLEAAGSATEWMAQRATRAFAGEDAVAQGQERDHEPGMARFATEVIRHGRASVAAGVHVSTVGGGTNEDLLRTIYSGRKRSEIEAAESEWQERYGKDLNEYLGIKEREWDAWDVAAFAISPAVGIGNLIARGGETSGDLAMELEILARGEPETDQDRLEIAMLRADQQQRRGTGFIGQFTMANTAENKDMNARREELAQMLLERARANQGTPPPPGQELPDTNNVFLPDGRISPLVAGLAFGTPPGANAEGAHNQFLGDRSRLFESMHELELAGKRYQSEQARQESLMLAGITVLAIAATVVLMAFGVGFVLAGMLVALGSGILTMAVKQGMRGERYGWEEAATDAAMTAIEVAAAGAGGALAGGFGTAGKLGSVVNAFNKLGPIAGPMAREALVGAISSAAQVALQDDTYDEGVGKAFEKIIGGGLKGAAVGAVSAGLSEAATSRMSGGLAQGLDGNDVGRMANLGRAMGPNARAMLTEVISEGVGSIGGEGVAIIIEVSKGEFRGGLDDALRRMGEGALKDMVSAAGRSAATSANKRRYADLLSEARSKDHLTDSDLRALRMAGAAAGEPFEGLDAVRARVIDGQHLLNTLPPEIRDRVRGLDADNLRALNDLLATASLGEANEDRQRLLREISEKAPQIDTVALTRELETVNAQRQAALERQQDAEALQRQQQTREQLSADLDPAVAERLQAMPVEGLSGLTRDELAAAADMIRGGTFDQNKADALLRTARANDPELDSIGFLRTLQTATAISRQAQQAKLAVAAQQREALLRHVPEEAKLLFAGLSDAAVAEVNQTLRQPRELEPAQANELYRQARELNPELTLDQFRGFLNTAAASARHEQESRQQAKRAEREQRMRNIPENLRGELSVLPDSALIELRIRQMEGSLSPAERNRLVESARQQNPELDVQRFNAALDEVVGQRPADGMDADTEAKLRAELLAGIPANQRDAVADVPIVTMRGAEFESFTHSQSGQAVTLLIHGRPVVVLREGADPAVLREEGIHVLQSKDPQWAARMGALDEQHLAHWDTLSLEQQLALYNNKVALEVDAQQRLIASLEADLTAADNPQRQNQLATQLEAARAALTNLSRRQAEVAGMDRLDVANIKAGFTERPQWLDQPARLFSKKSAAEQAAERQRAPPVARTEEVVARETETTQAEPLDVVKQRFLAGLKPDGDTAADTKARLAQLDEQTLRDLDVAAGDPTTARRLLNMAIDSPAGTRDLLAAVLPLSPSLRHQAVRKLARDSATAAAIARDLAQLNTLLLGSPHGEAMMARLVESSGRATEIKALRDELQRLQTSVGADGVERLLQISGEAAHVRAVIEQVARAANPQQFADAVIRINNALPPAERGRYTAELARGLKDTQLKAEMLAKIADLAVDGATKLNIMDELVNRLDDVDAVISRVKMISAVDTLVDAAAAVNMKADDVARLLTGLIGKHEYARNRFEFIESTAVLFKQLAAAGANADARIIAEHVFHQLTVFGPIRPQDAKHLESDLRNAASLLAESVDKTGLLALFSSRLQNNESMTGGDPTETKIQEALSKWPKFETDNPDFVKALKDAAPELGEREYAVLADIAPWFRELAAMRGVTDADGEAALLRELLKAQLGDDLGNSGYSNLRDVESAIRNTVVDESVDARLPSVRDYLLKHGVTEKQLETHLLATAEDFKQAYLEGRTPPAMHVEALIAQEHRVKTMLAIAERIGASTAGLKQQLTEVQGEMAFTIHMLTNPDFADCRPVRGFEVGTGFDQVWERVGADGTVTELIVGEAKGPGATLGTSLKGEQMSPEWIINTATELINQGGAAKQLGERIIQAMVDGYPPIRGIVVTAGKDDAPATVDDRGHFNYGEEIIHQS